MRFVKKTVNISIKWWMSVANIAMQLIRKMGLLPTEPMIMALLLDQHKIQGISQYETPRLSKKRFIL
jgi:hypothetical protein